MAQYILFPSTYKGLGEEAKRLIDDYKRYYPYGTVASEMIETVKAWSRNCDFMLDEDGSVAAGLVTHIGIRRSRIIQSALKS